MPEESPREEAAVFRAPEIQHNSTGWGPCDMPDQFKDMPYQPFSKADRLGKVNAVVFVMMKPAGAAALVKTWLPSVQILGAHLVHLCNVTVPLTSL